MKKMINTEKFTDRDWEELALSLSEEKENQSELLKEFLAADSLNTKEHWKELRNMNDNKGIDVDKALNKVWSRLNEAGVLTPTKPDRFIFMRSTFMKIAAVALILLSVGAAVAYLVKTDSLNRKIVVTTGNEEKNLRITLPDGSNVFLNSNTRLSYRNDFGKSGRNVVLSGEGFFEIKPDADNPFTVDAGTAKVKVTGTSFNVITNNVNSAVEVFVETGQVILSDNSGDKNLLLDPGYVGTLDEGFPGKILNDNPNYRSWNTGILKYNGQTLNIVFNGLKRAYNMEIVANDPDILNKTWVITIDNLSQDTIIRLICGSFNLSYTKDGNVYLLENK